MDEAKAVWFPVDVDTLPAPVKAKYQALQKAQKAAQTAREEFETAFTAAAKKAERVDADVSLAFGYRFGKLAVAKVDKTKAKPGGPTKPKFSF